MDPLDVKFGGGETMVFSGPAKMLRPRIIILPFRLFTMDPDIFSKILYHISHPADV